MSPVAGSIGQLAQPLDAQRGVGLLVLVPSSFWVQNYLTIRKASMVTSQKEQIQSLIADIERVLGAAKPRTPWIKASETEPQRQMLAQAQAYLVSLQQLFEAPGGWGPVDPTTGQLDTQAAEVQVVVPSSLETPARSTDSLADSSVGTSAATEGKSAEAKSDEELLQALRTEMQFLKSSALQPLRLEIDSLQSVRESLQREVETLEEERSHLSQALADLASEEQSEPDGSDASSDVEPASDGYLEIGESQLNQFLAVLMERIQENLSVQVTQTLEQLESDHSAAVAAISAAAETEQLALRPSREQQIEEMRQLQSHSDQLLVNIDSTLQRMFETLQNNIDTYQISLNEGIENMHSLGRQGEVIVRSLVDHLTAQLGQTTPPEPTFFSPREASALPPELEAPIPTEDTVSSLNEILPDETLPVAVAEPSSGEQIYTEDVLTEDVLAAEVQHAARENRAEENSDLETATNADTDSETFIHEDGTIDVDLLKLDIDRSQEDDLTPDDIMVDAATADALVAATESEDADIEAKVTPTVDAEFLAGLTIEDLTVDNLSGEVGEISTDVASVEPETFSADTQAETDVEETEAVEETGIGSDDRFEEESENDIELAAVLPDLGPFVTLPTVTETTEDSSYVDIGGIDTEYADSASIEEETAVEEIDSTLSVDSLDADDSIEPTDAIVQADADDEVNSYFELQSLESTALESTALENTESRKCKSRKCRSRRRRQ